MLVFSACFCMHDASKVFVKNVRTALKLPDILKLSIVYNQSFDFTGLEFHEDTPLREIVRESVPGQPSTVAYLCGA